MATAAPYDRNAFFTMLRTAALTATGLSFVRANQAAPAPSAPYGTFDIIGITPLYGPGPDIATHDATAPAGEETVLHTGGQSFISVRFQAYTAITDADNDAMSYLNKLSWYLQSDASTVILSPFALVEPKTPTDISALVGAVTHSRATLDLDMAGYLAVQSGTWYIQNTIVTADTVDDVDGTILNNSSQTIVGV